MFLASANVLRGSLLTAESMDDGIALMQEGKKRGREKEVRELLQGIYGWFTEGFGTPDLVDAKALLDELS